MNINLVQTCCACPEQYDAYDAETREQVAYLRLRHGWFYVTCPYGGETVYMAFPKGDGAFEEEEREKYLSEAKKAIVKFYTSEDSIT